MKKFFNILRTHFYACIMKYSLLLTVLLFSCKKDATTTVIPPGDNSKILGTWTFSYMTASTVTTSIRKEGNDTYKTIGQVTDYTTINNAGEMMIDSENIIIKDFTYAAKTSVFLTEYKNDEIPFENTLTLFNFTYPLLGTFSSSATYSMVGNDSLYISAGTETMNNTTVSSRISGARIGWSGDTLIYTITTDTPGSSTYTGVSVQTRRYIRK